MSDARRSPLAGRRAGSSRRAATTTTTAARSTGGNGRPPPPRQRRSTSTASRWPPSSRDPRVADGTRGPAGSPVAARRRARRPASRVLTVADDGSARRLEPRAGARHQRRRRRRRRAGPARHHVLAGRQAAVRDYTDRETARHVSTSTRWTVDGQVDARHAPRDHPRQPAEFANHNGGDIHFGPDGFLYWGLGDGGSQGDPERQRPGHRRRCSAKILRIDPEGPDGDAAYGIPDGQPVRRRRRRARGLAVRRAQPVALLVRRRDGRPLDRRRRRRARRGDRPRCPPPTGAAAAPTSAGARWRAATRSRATTPTVRCCPCTRTTARNGESR